MRERDSSKKIETFSLIDSKGNKTYCIRYKHRGEDYCEAVGPLLTNARKALAIRKAEIAQNKWGIGKVAPHKIEELAEKYREYIRANNLLGHNYESLIKNILGYFAGRKISEITPIFIEKYKLYRQRSKRAFHNGIKKVETARPVKPASVNRELAVLSKMFNIAVSMKWITANPVHGVRRLREDNKMERILDQREEHALLQACDQTRASHLRAIVLIALNSGMRLSEILTLRWAQIDLVRDVITLVRTKNGKIRRIDINSRLKEVFQTLPSFNQQDYVFPSELRKERNLGCVKKAFRNACKLASIDGLRFHDLRHTWATRLIEKGVSTAVVRDLGGWSDLSILNRYAHSTPGARKQAVELLVSDQKVGSVSEKRREYGGNEGLVIIGSNHK